ncbi:hypothetical protein MASR2M47_07880 [Draconibacterium sp.]
MKKLIFILGFLLSVCHSFAQVEADSTIRVRTTEMSKIYGYKHINHDNQKPGWGSPDMFVDTPSDIHPKLQKAIVKSLLPETLNKLKGKSIVFSFNIQGSGKIKSTEIIVPLNRNVELSKKSAMN